MRCDWSHAKSAYGKIQEVSTYHHCSFPFRLKTKRRYQMYASLTILRSQPRSLAFQIILSLGIFIGIVCPSVSAQIGGIDSDPGDRGTGGINTIQGNIYIPGGRRLDRRTKVTLRRSSGGAE